MCAWKNLLQASLLQKCLRRDSEYTFLATALVILLIWACHLSWSSRITPRWRCSETCSITCEFNMRGRGGIPRWCFWRVATTILLVFSGLSNIAFAERERERERERVLDKVIILSKFVTEKERIHLHYSKIIVFVVLLSWYRQSFLCAILTRWVRMRIWPCER